MQTHLRQWQVGATLSIIVLSTASALLGLLRPGHYNDAPAQVELYRVQDATILLVGVPVLALGLWYARAGSLRGRLVWLGALAYTAYTWATVGLQVSFNELFLVYTALVSLSLAALVGGVLGTDPTAVRDALDGRVSPRRYSALLVVIGAGLAGLWLSDIVPALLAGEDPQIVRESGQQALVSHFVDLAVVVPALLLSAAWLRQRRAWGYVAAGVVLVLGATLAPGIAAMTVVIATGDAVTLSPVAAALTFLPVALAALLTARYVTAIPRREGDATADREQGQSV